MVEKKIIKRQIPEKKIKAVKELAAEMKNSESLMIVSTKNLPSQQFQKIKKDLREKAKVRVMKKSILIRAIDEINSAEMNGLKEYVQSDCAIILSKEDAFELASWLAENRSPISARQGQIADEDIKIEKGPTDLLPGPAISELGAVGLKVAVEGGKIAIREPKIITKKGGVITEGAASVLQKLGIKPFMIGLNPAVIYDSHTKKIYVGVKIDKKGMLVNLLSANAKALGFSVSIAYPTKQNIGLLLAKANAHFNALNKTQKNLMEVKI